MSTAKRGRTPALKDYHIPLIVDMIKHRMTVADMARTLGLHYNTIHGWIAKGKESKSSIYRKLYDAIQEAEAGLVKEYASLVRKGIIEGYDEQTTKITQLQPDGSKVEITTKKAVPNMAYALKMLAQMRPAQYADVQRLQIDYRESIQRVGLDPTEVERAYFEHLEANKDQLPIPIPAIPERSV